MMKTLVEALIGKHNINNAEINVFSKKYLKTGDIVMFRDKTFGVYVEGDLAKRLKEEYSFNGAADKWFFTHTYSKHLNCYFNLEELDYDLRHDRFRSDQNYDIIRVYSERLEEKEIEKIAYNFYNEISYITRSMGYKERK